jgi:hypothetical protein
LNVSNLIDTYLQDETERTNLVGTSSFDPKAKQSISFMALKKFLHCFNFSNSFLLAFDY